MERGSPGTKHHLSPARTAPAVGCPFSSVKLLRGENLGNPPLPGDALEQDKEEPRSFSAFQRLTDQNGLTPTLNPRDAELLGRRRRFPAALGSPAQPAPAPAPLPLTSARRTILFPSGQMTWSTWDLTLSQVSSGVRRLAWNRAFRESKRSRRSQRRSYTIGTKRGSSSLPPCRVYGFLRVRPCPRPEKPL